MAEEVKKDNLSEESPDLTNEAVNDAVLNVDGGEDFFDKLDREVNKQMYQSAETEDNTGDNPSEVTSNTGQTEQSPQESATSGNEQNHNWEKRYIDSSNEAKRLNTQVKDFEQYSPILNALKSDPRLVSHVKAYYEGNNNQTPQTIKEELKLPEDFIFDPEEAVSNPNSASAKVFGTSVDKIVQARIQQYAQTQNKKQTASTTRDSFIKEKGMTKDEYKDMMGWAKSHKLSLDDIHFLKNRESRDNNVRESVLKDENNQRKRMQDRPVSLSNSGSESTDVSVDESVFGQILNVDNDLDNIFNS
jgi:hypothetical protein